MYGGTLLRIYVGTLSTVVCRSNLRITYTECSLSQVCKYTTWSSPGLAIGNSMKLGIKVPRPVYLGVRVNLLIYSIIKSMYTVRA